MNFNTDGNFSYAESHPYSVSCTSIGQTTCGNPQFNYAPWQTLSWGISSYQWCVGGGLGYVYQYSFNIGSGSAYALVGDQSSGSSCFPAGVSVAKFIQGFSPNQANWYSPPQPFWTSGRTFTIPYDLKRNYYGIDPASGEMGILFDIRADVYYNGAILHRDLLMDFYVHQECYGFAYFICLGSNVGSESTPPSEPDAYIYMWRIHSNIPDNTWVSDNPDITNYIAQSAQWAVCADQGQPSNCSLGPPTVNLKSFESITEAHLATEGLTFGYANLCTDTGTTPDKPAGPTFVQFSYPPSTYTSSSTCLGPNRQFKFDWGDGTTTTTGLYTADVTASASHSWRYSGWYSVKVQATYDGGVTWSPWSLSLQVAVQYGICPPHCSPTG